MTRTLICMMLVCAGLPLQARLGSVRSEKSGEDQSMAFHRWISADGDWGNTASWDIGVVPGPTDTATFDGASQLSVTAGLDQSATTILRIITTPAYTGDIGSSGNPLVHEIESTSSSNGRILHRGTGQFFFRGDVGGFSDVLVDSSRSLSSGAAFVGDGTLRNLFVKQGKVNIISTCNLTNHVVVDGPGSYLIIDEKDAAEAPPTILWVRAGLCENARSGAGDLVIITGGRLRQTGTLPDAITILQSDGIFQYVPFASVSGLNPDLLTVGGLMDTSESYQDIEFDNIIIGQLGNVQEGIVQAGDFGPLSTFIDLRKDYP